MNYRTQYRQVYSINSNKFSQVQSMSINNLQQSEKTFFSLNIGKIAHNRLDQTSASKLSPTSSLKRAENAISSTRSETIIGPVYKHC